MGNVRAPLALTPVKTGEYFGGAQKLGLLGAAHSYTPAQASVLPPLSPGR